MKLPLTTIEQVRKLSSLSRRDVWQHHTRIAELKDPG